METIGSSVFHRHSGFPSAKMLSAMIAKHHPTVKKRKPYPHEMTWLIHPSPVSEAALKFGFQVETTAFSPFSSDFFHQLDKLEEAFALYIFANLLVCLERDCPHFFATSHAECREKIKQILDWTQFITRAEALAHDFKRAVIYYLTLNVVPVRYFPFSPYHCVPPVNEPDHIKLYTESFLLVLETTMSTVRIASVEEICTDMVLSYRDGVYGCSTFKGDPYLLWSFDSAIPLFSPGICVRAPLIDIMQDEYQYTFANAKHRQQGLEKMTKTSIIVSSSLTEEAGETLKMLRKENKQDTSKISLPNSSQDQSKKTNANPGDVVETQLSTLKAAIDIRKTIDKHLVQHTNRLNALSDIGDETTIHIDLEPQQRDTIHGPQVSVGNRKKVVQEQMLKKERNRIQAKLATTLKERQVLVSEIHAMIQNESTLAYQNKTKDVEIGLLRKKLKEIHIDHDRISGEVTRYKGLLEEMAETVNDVLKQMNANEEEKDRLLNLLTRADAPRTIDSQFDKERDRQQWMTLVEMVFNSTIDRSSKDDGQGEDRPDFTENAYNNALEGRATYPIPFFTSVQNQNVLDFRNYWLPYLWMKDKPLNTTVQARSHKKDAAGRRAVTNTPELFMLDVNPKTSEEQHKVEQAIAAANGTTVLDSVFQRTFLNVQFPVQGSVDAVINDPLKQKWKRLTTQLLRLSGETFTKNGQRVGAKVSTESIKHFVAPFITQYLGERFHNNRLLPLVANSLEGGFLKLSELFLFEKFKPDEKE